jgi:hypothetical protein
MGSCVCVETPGAAGDVGASRMCALRAVDDLAGDKTHVDTRCRGRETRAVRGQELGREGCSVWGKQPPPSSHLGLVRSSQTLTTTASCQEGVMEWGLVPLLLQEDSQEQEQREPVQGPV